jgi:hypothetical protein
VNLTATSGQLARVRLRKRFGRTATGFVDYGRELRFAAVARVEQRKRYCRCATPDSNTALRQIARVSLRERCGRTATGFVDSGRELRFAELLARMNPSKFGASQRKR